MEEQAYLVCERRAAAGAVRGELALVQLDQVLGLAAGAVEDFVDMLRRAGFEAGDDEADVEPPRRRLDAAAGAARRLPRLRPVTGLGEAAQAGLFLQRPAGADVVGSLVDETVCEALQRQPVTVTQGHACARSRLLTGARDGRDDRSALQG